MNFNFLGIYTEDVDRTKDFLSQTFHIQPQQAEDGWAYYRLGDFVMELFYRKGDSVKNISPLLMSAVHSAAIVSTSMDDEGNTWLSLKSDETVIQGAVVSTKDPKRLQDFYQKHFSLNTIVIESFDEISTQEGIKLFLYRSDIQPDEGNNSVLLSFEVDDIAKYDAYFTEQGVSYVRQRTLHDWGGDDIMILDSDGNKIQVVEYKQKIV